VNEVRSLSTINLLTINNNMEKVKFFTQKNGERVEIKDLSKKTQKIIESRKGKSFREQYIDDGIIIPAGETGKGLDFKTIDQNVIKNIGFV
jgi:hypothetical protein